MYFKEGYVCFRLIRVTAAQVCIKIWYYERNRFQVLMSIVILVASMILFEFEVKCKH